MATTGEKSSMPICGVILFARSRIGRVTSSKNLNRPEYLFVPIHDMATLMKIATESRLKVISINVNRMFRILFELSRIDCIIG